MINKNINVTKIYFKTFLENTNILFSIMALFCAYWLQDIVFPNTFGKFTSDIPNFVDNITFKKVMNIVYPFFLAEICFYINNVISSKKIPKIELNVVKKITSSVIESIKTSKKEVNINELIMNLKKVIETKSIYQLIVSSIIPFILVAIGFIYGFMKANIKMGVIALVIISIFLLITFMWQKESISASCKNEDAINELYDDIQDVMINSDVVITSNMKNTEMINLDKTTDKVISKYSESELKASENTFFLHLLSLLTILILDGIAIKMYMNGEIKTESLVSTCLISVTFMKYFNSAMTKFRNSIGSIGKYSEISKYFLNFNINDMNNNNLIIKNGDIDLKNINLQYGNKKILDNFSINIKGGSKVGIIGKVGSGKTSILKMISGLINYEGNIYIDKQNLNSCNYDSVLNNIIYIPQHPKMFNKTILYNISYGTKYEEKYINDFLQKIGFDVFFKKFDNGLNTKVGKEGSHLSGGQKQIIAIIRSLLQNKMIIMLDEPTSSLDPELKSNIINLLKKIDNKTLLIVTHDESLYDLFDEIIKIEKK